jgi:hypothetical protein
MMIGSERLAGLRSAAAYTPTRREPQMLGLSPEVAALLWGERPVPAERQARCHRPRTSGAKCLETSCSTTAAWSRSVARSVERGTVGDMVVYTTKGDSRGGRELRTVSCRATVTTVLWPAPHLRRFFLLVMLRFAGPTLCCSERRGYVQQNYVVCCTYPTRTIGSGSNETRFDFLCRLLFCCSR